MSPKPDRTKPLQTCRNPVGCTNPCEPGKNFCESCRRFFGMPDKPAVARANGYRYPIIGMGPVGQTHLKPVNQEDKPMEMLKETAATGGAVVVEPPQPEPPNTITAICPEHGPHGGTTLGNHYTPTLCPACVKEKRSTGLKVHSKGDPRGVYVLRGFKKGWVEEECKRLGMNLKEYLDMLIIAEMPAEDYKAGVLADMRRGGKES